MMSRTGLFVVVVVCLIIATGVIGWAIGGSQRNVPEEARKVKSPIPLNADASAAGKKLFDRHCAVCHGDDGKGNTDMAESLPKKPADLTRKEMEGLSEGEIFWVVSNGLGKSGMPAFQKKLNDTERWQVVAFARSLSASKP